MTVDNNFDQSDHREEAKSEHDIPVDLSQSLGTNRNIMPQQRVMTSTQFYTFKTVKPIEPQPKKKSKRRKDLVGRSSPELTTAFAQNFEPSEEMLLRLLKNLQEKHNNKTLSALDHKLLIKL